MTMPAVDSTGTRTGLRAVIYSRISDDTEGAGLGVARQETDCRSLVERRGWEVAGVYVDNDISASSYGRKRRPQFAALMAAASDGTIDAIVAWDLDRITRRPQEAEQMWDDLIGTGVRVTTVSGDDIDLATGEGMLVARIKMAMAAEEVRKMSQRIKRKMDELAQSGKPGGQARTFGYDRPRDEDGKPIRGARTFVVEREAERIREAARRVLAGESLYAIVRDWTAAGVPTIKGAPWSTTALKTVLTAPRIAGLRVHRGAVVGEAEWDAILDVPTWERVRSILTDPRRKRSRVKRSYLLSGLVRCGVCDHPLVATPRRRKVGGGRRGEYRYEDGATQRAYGCVKANGGCGSVFILAEPLEEWVEQRVVVALTGPKLDRARQRLERSAVDERGLLDAIGRDEQMLAELGSDFADRLIPRAAFVEATARVQGRIDEARGRLAERTGATALEGIADLADEWDELSMERRRSIISTVMAPTVGPALGARNRFDEGRIDPGWRV